MGHIVETVGVGGIDRLEPLWTAMVEHHRAVSSLPVRSPEEAWRRRRVQYEQWLAQHQKVAQSH